MSIFTFESKSVGFGSPTVTINFEADQVEDVIWRFNQFLNGCGYDIEIDTDSLREKPQEDLDAFTENLFNNIHADHTVITGGAGVDVITLGDMKYEFDKNVQI
jgi:hypothetical protein